MSDTAILNQPTGFNALLMTSSVLKIRCYPFDPCREGHLTALFLLSFCYR